MTKSKKYLKLKIFLGILLFRDTFRINVALGIFFMDFIFKDVIFRGPTLKKNL